MLLASRPSSSSSSRRSRLSPPPNTVKPGHAVFPLLPRGGFLFASILRRLLVVLGRDLVCLLKRE